MPRYLPKENENICLDKDMMKMFRGILFTIIKKAEAVQTSVK